MYSNSHLHAPTNSQPYIKKYPSATSNPSTLLEKEALESRNEENKANLCNEENVQSQNHPKEINKLSYERKKPTRKNSPSFFHKHELRFPR
jgi:hypothetical protein